jgi:hypothetical protein
LFCFSSFYFLCPMLFVSLCFLFLRCFLCPMLFTNNIGYKKQNEDKQNKETQTTLGTRNRTKTNKTKRHKQHWTQETERRQTKQRDTNNIGRSVSCVLCWLFCLSSFCVLCRMSNVDCLNKTVNIGHRTQDTERRQTKQSTLDIEHKAQNENKQNSQHWT